MSDEREQTSNPFCIGLGGLWVAVLTLIVAASGYADAQTPAPAPISVELNKLEPLSAATAAPGTPAGCRVYLVVANPGTEPVAQLRLDLILFGTDGVIARRVALDLAPLAARKTSVRPFDLQAQPCDSVGRLLINDVLECQTGTQGDAAAKESRQACLDRLQLASRAKAEFAK